MPTYNYQCSGCDHQFTKVLRFDDRNAVQGCPECGTAPATKVLGSGAVGFVLKGDGWTGKNMVLKDQMKAKNARLDRKMEEQRRNAPGMTLAPNVDGERVDSWAEAQRLAKAKGKKTDTYDQMVRKEAAR